MKKYNKRSFTHTRQKWGRILRNQFFRRLQKAYEKNPTEENLNKLIAKARKKFKLSIRWYGFLKLYLSGQKIDPNGFGGAAEFYPVRDQTLKQDVYIIIVYPETTQDDTVQAHSKIKGIYRSQGRSTRSELSIREEIEFRALDLRRDKKSYKEVAEILNEEFHTNYKDYHIGELLKNGQKKLNKL